MEGIRSQFFQIFRNLRFRERKNLALVIDQTALLINCQHIEILQIIQNSKVCQVAGSQSAPVIQQEVPGRMQTCHLDNLDGIRTHGHSLTADIVNVAFFQKVIRVLVIGAEHAPVKMPGRFHQVDQRLQILGGGALTNHDKLTQP